MSDARQSTYRLGDVCDRTGLTPKRIRDYERLGLIDGIQRTVGGQRVYTEDQLQTLHTIVRLRRARLPLQDIRLTVRVLNASVLGIQADGVRRIRTILAVVRTELNVLDEIAQALERRLSPGRLAAANAPTDQGTHAR